jgi:hypothetical protein
MSSVVLTTWPVSMVLAAVLGFRIGLRWSEIHRISRHTFIPRHPRNNHKQHRRRSRLRRPIDPLSRRDIEFEDHSDRVPTEVGADLDTDTIPLPPALARPLYSASADANTEILPRLQDIRPPMRATPIRRPPWVGGDGDHAGAHEHRTGFPAPQERLHGKDQMEPVAPLWDPRQIDPERWEEVGVDPSTLTTDIAGRPEVSGFKRCGGTDRLRVYAISVWSQRYTVEDFQRKEAGIKFAPITIAGRTGFRYRPRADHNGDQCCLIFPAAHGSCSIEVLRLDPNSPLPPADRAIAVAQVMVPLLPN